MLSIDPTVVTDSLFTNANVYIPIFAGILGIAGGIGLALIFATGFVNKVVASIKSAFGGSR